MTDTLQQVLDTPGCERLKDFASVGPAQRAALELFVDRIRAADQQAEPVAWAISYDGVQPYSLWDFGDGPLLDLEVKRLGGAWKKMPLYTSPSPAPLSEEEMILRGWRRCAVGQSVTQYCGQLEAAVAAEREACARECEDVDANPHCVMHHAIVCAESIRWRGEKVSHKWTDTKLGSVLHSDGVLLASVKPRRIGFVVARWHNGMTWDISDQLTLLSKQAAKHSSVRAFDSIKDAKAAIDAAMGSQK